MSKYRIIYADPPWSDGGRNDARGIKSKYPTMETEELCNFPIKNLAEEDCFLFIWVVSARLKDAFKVIEAWGFEYKTIAFVWIKTTNQNTFYYGMGNWTRSNAELCLIATKGNCKRINADVNQIVKAPRKEHSKKPNEVREKILRLCGDLPRIELFARTKVHGWDVWGNDERLDFQPLEVFNK